MTDEEKAGDHPANTTQKSTNDLMTNLIPKTSIASIKESTRSATAAMSTTAELSFRDGKRAIVEKSARSLKAVEETSVRGLKAVEEKSSKSLKLAEEAAARAAAGLDALLSEIANHYLDGLKYGMAGSDGTCWSNYVLY
jgi:nitrogen-specific signal transduction histidine kinase